MAQRRRRVPRSVPAHVGLALLTHHLGYFDSLPLYVVLMLMALGVMAARGAIAALCALAALPAAAQQQPAPFTRE
jgi:hypothetical protein